MSDTTTPAEPEIPAVALAAFRAVWREVGDLPYGPARSANYVRPDGTLDVPALRAADAECDRLNDDVIRRAIGAAQSRTAPQRDQTAGDMARRDDLARDVAREWRAVRGSRRCGTAFRAALDALAAVYGPTSAR